MPVFVTLVKMGPGGAKNLTDLDKSYMEGMKMSEQMGELSKLPHTAC